MKKYVLKLTSAFVALAIAQSALAAPQAVTPDDAADDASPDEIVVTATRRDTTTQNTPLTISALSEDALANRGIRSVDDIAYAVPGLSFTSNNDGSETLSVRGIVAFGSTATTAYYIDETPIAQLAGGTFSPRYFDIERVEVLRGPQGTLYGASSMGGAVRIITKKPNLTDFEGAIRAEGSTTKLGKGNGIIDGVVSVPIISDRLALRVTGFYEKNSGWVKNFRPVFSSNPADYVDLGVDGLFNNGIFDPADPDFDPLNLNDDVPGVAYAGLGSAIGTRIGGEVIYGGRAALRAQPNDAITLTGSYSWQQRKNNGLNSADRSLGLGLDGTDFRQARAFDEFRKLRSQLANFTAEADLGAAKLTSSTSYEWSRENSLGDGTALLFGNIVGGLGIVPQDTAGRSGVGIASLQNKTSLTQEVRLVSQGDGRLNWIVGGFYNKTKLRFSQDLPAYGLAAALIGTPFEGAAPNDSFGGQNQFEPRREFSVFGEVGYKFSDVLSATIGARRYDVKTGAATGITGIVGGGAPAIPLTFVKDNGFTYKANINYQPAKDILLFAGYTTGYRPGGVNPPKLLASDNFPAGFTSDKLAQYELGWKSRFLDRALTINGALFYIDWSDIPTSDSAPSGVTFIFNGPKARTYGGELEIIMRPTKGMDFTLGTTILDAKFDADFPAQGIAKGDTLPNVPKYTINGAFNYEWSIGGDTTARVNANVAHVSARRQFASDLAPALPGFVTAGLSAGVSFGQVDFSIFARNLFDERALVGNQASGVEISGGVAGGVSRVSYIQPRTIGVSIQVKY